MEKNSTRPGNDFHFTLAGLILFSLALIVGTSFVGNQFFQNRSGKLADSFAVNPNDPTQSIHVGPWGVLTTRDVILERPVELLSADTADPKPDEWRFNGMNPDAVRALLARNGLSPAQITTLFARGTISTDERATILRPPVDFVFSLDAKTRQKLYMGLGGLGVNGYIDCPVIFPGDNFDAVMKDERVNPEDLDRLKRLIYVNSSSQAKQLSDYGALLVSIPTAERRVAMARVLTRLKVVFAGLAIKPDTDTEKIAGYWGQLPGVRFNDIRPLLEAFKALPQGGTLRLYYLLPKLARERLYTYPLPPRPGEPVMDCYWTAFNFASDPPDNHLHESTNLLRLIDSKYYQINAPGVYGDILLLMDSKNKPQHAAVYLADDLFFTKNGENHAMPWVIMHSADLRALYPANLMPGTCYLRRKDN